MTDRELAPAGLKVRRIFERHRDRPWIFVRPLGNWGDHLIFAGAERMADALGLRWTSCETAQFQSMIKLEEHCVYLHGGGGYNNWSSGRSFVNLELALSQPVRLVVQGPVSTEGDSNWLANRFRTALSHIACREFFFFAREEHTLGVLNQLALQNSGATLCLDHDTALSLTAQDLLAIAGLRAMPARHYDLVVVREDNERPDAAKAGASAGRATRSTGFALDPVYAATSFRHWVRIHLFARSITTNRLHSAIIGAIAGKPVTIGPGSYHKNRSVWQYSLAERGVRWVDAIEPPAAGLWQRLPSRIRDSYKIRQLRLALHRVPLS